MYGQLHDGGQAEFFTEAVVDGQVVHCEKYERSSRRKNSVVGLTDGTVVKLEVFVVVGGLCFAFARLVNVDRPPWLRRDGECGLICGHACMESGRH